MVKVHTRGITAPNPTEVNGAMVKKMEWATYVMTLTILKGKVSGLATK